MGAIGRDEHNDFNRFLTLVNKTLKTLGLKLSATEKKPF